MRRHAEAACAGPDGWVGALPPAVSVERAEQCGQVATEAACYPRKSCGRCSDIAHSAGGRFDLSAEDRAVNNRLIAAALVASNSGLAAPCFLSTNEPLVD